MWRDEGTEEELRQHNSMYIDISRLNQISKVCDERKRGSTRKSIILEACCESNHYCLQKFNEAIKSDIEILVTKNGDYAKWRTNQGNFP